MDENDVNIERNKRLLEEIREGRHGRDDTIGSRGYAESRTRSNDQDEGGNQRLVDRASTAPGSDDRRTQTPRTNESATERHSSRNRPPGRTAEPTSQGVVGDNRKRQENIIPPIEEKTRFRLKIPFVSTDAEKSKLFTKQEAQEELERLTEIYFRGSGLLDDILEIVVKDHEPVQIWQLSEDESDTIARMHLSQAQKDKAAARSARKLLEIYDRIYVYMVVLPRVKASYGYVKEHKGFSWR